MVAAAAIAAGATVAGSAISAGAASSAAGLQGQAAKEAQISAQLQYQDTRTDLSPYYNNGSAASDELRSEMGLGGYGVWGTTNDPRAILANSSLGIPGVSKPDQFSWNPTQAQLEQTPGFQFSLDQGLKAAQNGFAAKGLASSGAALKGAADYAEGLAGTTYQQNYNIALGTNQQQWANYQNQFANYLQQTQQRYNQLAGVASLGENAAALTGQQGVQATQNAGNFGTAGAAAQAAGTVGTGNAINAGLGGLSQAYQQYATNNVLQGFLGGNTAGSGQPYQYGGSTGDALLGLFGGGVSNKGLQ